MTVYGVAKKVLGTENLSQNVIPDLNSGITFIVLCSQEKPLQEMEINTHARESKLSADFYSVRKTNCLSFW